MTDAAFANAGQPHGALFDDAPRQPYHVTDAAMLRAAYGPAAVPSDDPSDEDYTWTEEAAPLVIPEVAPNAPENIAALIADVDYWTKAIHEASQHLRRVSEQLAQMKQSKTL
jgi:hypothetical protein